MNHEQGRYIASIGGDGIIQRKDIAHLKAGVKEVFKIMSDGRWYTIRELRKAIDQEEAGRRMRELREAGINIEKRRSPFSRAWHYRNLKSHQFPLLDVQA